MRILLALVVIAATAWGGYWFVGARALEHSAETWFQEQDAIGIDARHEGVRVLGFPSRFDLTVSAPRILDRWTGFGWEAPFLQLFALSYRPNHVIAVWPHEQTLHLPRQSLDIRSDDLRASAVFGDGLAMALLRASLVGEDLWLGAAAGWQIGVDTLRFATRRTGTEPERHDMALEAFGIVPDPRWSEGLPPEVAPPPRIGQARLDLNLAFDGPLDRNAPGRPLRPTAAEVKDIRLTWGDMLIEGAGELVFSAGQPQGSILLRVRNWQQMLGAAVTFGLVHPEIAQTWESALELLEAEYTGADGAMEVPLRFERGRMSLGPMPLGAAPVFFPG